MLRKLCKIHSFLRLGSDVTPAEVTRVVSDKTIEVRWMKSEISPDWKPEFVEGGFAGHCTNNLDQKWIIESDEDQEPFRLRFSNKYNAWRDKYGRRFYLSENPVRRYDYNF